MRHRFSVLISAIGLAGCNGDDGLTDPPPNYGSDDTSGSVNGIYQAGDDPYEEGELRAGIADFYEGPSSSSIAVDDVDVFFYVWEDTFSAIQNFEEPAEGLYSLEWFSKGRGWWGGGIHHTTGSFDISMYNTLHLAMRSSSAEMADITVGMVSVDSTSDATVQAADYGWTADGTWHTIEIPLADFEAAGAALTAIETPLFLVGENATTEGESIWFDDIYLTDHVGSTAIDDGDGGDDGGDGKQTPLLENGGFETFSAGSDGVNRPDVWEVYPTERSNWSSSDPTQSDFTALEGEAALVVWGAGTGSENETAIYQTFEPVNGATYTLTGSAWMPAFDPISDAHTYAMLQVKMFNSSWGMVDSFESEAIDLKTSVDTWTSLTASGTASSSVAYVQAAVQFWQCVDQSESCSGGAGSVYFDDLQFVQAE